MIPSRCLPSPRPPCSAVHEGSLLMTVFSFRPWCCGRVALALVLGALAPGAAAAADRLTPEQAEFFEKEVRPLLAERCFDCHGGKKTRGGLKLTSRAGILQGGNTRPAAVPGRPDESLLIQAVRQTGDLKMPPKTKLSDRAIAQLARWVELGLPWPETPAATAGARPDADEPFTVEQHRFWSFLPVQVVPPPPVKDRAWPRSDIDRHVLAALEARGLHPAPAADRRTLLRRATFDLTGLPPTPGEIDAFLADHAPDAFARVVDHLLASPAYGERWGRHWLDVVRYTDSFDARILSGPGNTMDIPEAYRYRDWVVDAFNRDLPYDQFVVNQVAGDLLPAPRPGELNVPGIVATGMLAMGNWGGGDADKEKLLTDIADDQIDVVCRGFLGLTMACARCHDHKFDPLLTDDYYGLAGIFFSTHILEDPGPKTNGPPMLRIPLLSPREQAQRKEQAARAAQLEKEVKQRRAEQQTAALQKQLAQTGRYMTAAWECQHRSREQAGLPLARFAMERGLHEGALRQWIEYLGLGEYRLLNQPVTNIAGQPGLLGWRGDADNPSATINTTEQMVAFSTIKMPPRSVAVHPSPTGGVAVAWRSPFAGTVAVAGRVADADPTCGDGIAWVVQQRQAGGVRELASGDIANGGAQVLSAGTDAPRLAAVDVQAGDTLLLVVLPKANYFCDTTVVELGVRECDGARRSWSLTQDLLAGTMSNPHADRHGNAEVWHFYDMAGSGGQAADAPPGSALARWRQVVAEAAQGNADSAAIEKAAASVQQTLAAAEPGKGPDARLYQELTSERSPFRPAVQDGKAAAPETRERLARLSAELAESQRQAAAPVPFAHGVQEGGCPKSPQAGIHDVPIHLRGRYDRLGKLVPRHFPRILAGNNQPAIAEGSGRMQLARWIARPENPLTARVIVNRIWQYHFGEGLVRTPGNFGKLGEPPTHPELLDYLAHRLVEYGWSLKALHREIVLSAVYQQSSVAPEETVEADPDNRLWGRMNRQRLEAEAIRDSLLAVAGRLDRTLGGKATQDFNTNRRTLYFMTIRSDRTSFRELFDAADPTAIIDKRSVSTVAPQALFLMNAPFALDQARALAGRLLSEERSGDRERINRAYELLYGRPPSYEETRVGLDFLSRTKSAERGWQEYCQILLCANEFVYRE
jgi:hypothetical protein